MAGDPYYNNVSLLVRGNGADNDTLVIDKSKTPKTITVGGNAKIVTGVNDPFGNSDGVIAFDGSGDYLAISSVSLGLKNVDFAIEAFVRQSAGGPAVQSLFSTYNSTGGATSNTNNHYLNNGVFTGSNGVVNTQTGSTATALVAGQWYFLAVKYISATSTINIYQDNVLVGSKSGAAITAGASNFYLGGSPGDTGTGTWWFKGYMSNLRITTGVNRSLVLPIAPFPDRQVRLSGAIAESSPITDWRVSAHKSVDGSLVGTTVINGAAYAIDCNGYDPCNITLAPKIDYAWQAVKNAVLDDYIVPANPDATPYLFKVGAAGVLGSVEPAYNTTPGSATVSGTATLICVGTLLDPKTIGPKIPN